MKRERSGESGDDQIRLEQKKCLIIKIVVVPHDCLEAVLPHSEVALHLLHQFTQSQVESFHDGVLGILTFVGVGVPDAIVTHQCLEVTIQIHVLLALIGVHVVQH